MATTRRTRVVACMLGGLLVAGPAGSGLAQTTPSPDLRQQFREVDANGDGRIDREEFHRRTTETFYMRDANKDGFLARTELVNMNEERFRLADRDGDGRLSLGEFLRARHQDFDAADTNGDGTLSFVEVEVYITTRP